VGTVLLIIWAFIPGVGAVFAVTGVALLFSFGILASVGGGKGGIDVTTIDNFLDQAKIDRSRYHLTLGELISVLEASGPGALVQFDFDHSLSPCFPHSYRGYYSDLAFEVGSGAMTAFYFLGICQGVLGETLRGYKGGEFLMSKDTPLWVADYGCSGRAIIKALPGDGVLILITKDVGCRRARL
jgi:hypothetical protein